MNDEILVRDSQIGKRTKMIGKYLILISIHKPHNDLIKSNNEGGLSVV